MSGIDVQLALQVEDFWLDASFNAPPVGVTAVFGPSGSGKTTLLRCIAGLEQATGRVRMNGEIWQDETLFVPVHKRQLGYVFQEASLFPHLSVRANLEYGFKRIMPSERKVQLDQIVAWLGLEQLIERHVPSGLSGGERQRVAIGRALLTSPRLLLMDEPLSALDHHSKQEILPYLQRLHRELNIPVLYVSHSLDEVARLADHLILLDTGKVIASGTLSTTLARLDLPTAHLEDAGTILEATVTQYDEEYHLTRLDFPGGNLWIGHINQPLGSRLRTRILARDVSIATVMPQGTSISNILTAYITDIREDGPDRVSISLNVGAEYILLSRITRRSCVQLDLAIGKKVFAQVKSVALVA